MKAYSIRNGEIFEPEVKEERTNKHRKEKEQECNCNRPYEIELTEQEWLQTCNTEQLAEKLTDFSFWLVVELPTNERREKVRTKLLEWLKQPHTKE